MPTRTWLTQEEKRAPGFKVAKDRFTLLFCANASGNLKCKPMMVYRSETPRALKNKNKNQLPVFWRSNKTAWATQINFEEWFHQSFVPDVKEFLIQRNLAFKVLLLMDNCKSHPQSLQDAHPNIEVMFLPPNTTALIQPMDQNVIATFKSYYLRRVIRKMVQSVNHHQICNDFNSENVVRNFWKNFTIMDSISYVEESWNEVSETTINASWRKLLPDVVPEKSKKNKQSELEEVLQGVINMAREIGGQGFQDLQHSEVLELVNSQQTEIPIEELEELADYSDEPEEEKNSSPPHFSAKIVLQVINHIQIAVELAMNNDPIMNRSLTFRRSCEVAIQNYEELYNNLRRSKQSQLTDYYKD